MKVTKVGGMGLHASEVNAINQMEIEFRDSWFAYAGLVLADNSGSMEIDCLIVTHDRLLLVELKEWNGEITSHGGQWFQNGKPRGTSPYIIKRNHAQRVKSLLKQYLSDYLTYDLHVEAHVVLCGTANADNIPVSERRYVFTLPEYLNMGKATHYNQIVQNTNFEHLFSEKGKSRPNSEKGSALIRRFFEGPYVSPKKFSVGSYVVGSDHPFFEHRYGIYKEYMGQGKDNDNKDRKALIRRWRFDQLGTKFAIQTTWANIALRESRIGHYVRDKSTTAQDYLLRSISDLTQEDITEDVSESYELRRTYCRLDDLISNEAVNWDKDTRIDMVRALLAPFSELHNLNIAHRDIDPHNLWYATDHKCLLASGFGTAFFPEKGSVSDHRRQLQSSPIMLPEDEMCDSGEQIDPFRLDVFMLGLVAYQICFSQGALPQVSGVPEWKALEIDPFEGGLNDWFEKALSWDPSERFTNAEAMLTAFNLTTAITLSQTQSEETKQIFDQLNQGKYLCADLNLMTLAFSFPPPPTRSQEAFEVLLSPNSKKSYLAEKDGIPLLIKVWSDVTTSPDQPGNNRRLLQFMQRIERVRDSLLPTPKVIRFGLMQAPGGLLVATEYVPGTTWSKYINHHDLMDEDKLALAISLVDTVNLFHAKLISHGDLHVENVLIAEPTEGETKPQIYLLDLLDFGGETAVFNTEYGPANPAVTDAFGRDRFAVFKMVEELFGAVVPPVVAQEIVHARANNQDCIPISLVPLQKALQNPFPVVVESNTPVDAILSCEPMVIHWKGSDFPNESRLLPPTEDGYYFHCVWHKDPKFADHLQCYITGSNVSLMIQLVFTDGKREIHLIRYQSYIPLSGVVSASRRSQTIIKTPIAMQSGVMNYSHPFVDYLMGLEPVLDALIERYSSENEPTLLTKEELESERQSISPVQIWQAIADTENDIRQSVIIESEDYKNAANGDPMFLYSNCDGVDLHLDDDDDMHVYMANKRNKADYIGDLNLNETTASYIAIEFRYNSYIKQFKKGTMLQLESSRNRSSRELRHQALQRVIDNKVLIPNLSCYFDSRQKAPIATLEKRPTLEELRDLYDIPGQEANDKQLLAFQQLVEMGPIGVLQGPPGTGKTSFISKFIHYLITHCGANNILLVGQQHSAVDNVAIKAQELCAAKGLNLDTVRIGNENLIDTRMMPVHSRALQQKIRFKFHREMELRICALAHRLGLPSELVQAVTHLHRSLSPLLVINSQYEREQSQIIKTGASSSQNIANQETLSQNLDELWNKIDTVVRAQLGVALGELPRDNKLLISQLTHSIATTHGVNNPSKLHRLLELLNLSTEWLDVLQGGGSGYEPFMLKTKQLVCGTLVGVGRRALELEKADFDWVIIDEAGRAQASELMVAIQCAKRVLLVGDHKQLPPFYQKEHLKMASKMLDVSQEFFEECDFERAYKACNGITLDTQYRMIEPIGDLVSACFYADNISKLHTGRGPSPDWYDALPAPWNKGVTWIDSSLAGGKERMSSNNSYFNEYEVEILMQMLNRFVDPEAPEILENLRETVTNEQPYPIGIITMYRGQKELIETRLNRAEWMSPLRDLIKINTVDSYQGQENKIIILSLVRDNPENKQGFLSHDSRINVSISRAQERLMILGASRMWSQGNDDSALGRVLGYINQQVSQTPESYQILTGEQIVKEHIA